ncbi:hypothetical protein HMPREF1144_5613 [Klebsiella sp. OBRC7]|nr:hypothetical protein HMPREF1144_5613 [Klebsiella sp. OBRC7]
MIAQFDKKIPGAGTLRGKNFITLLLRASLRGVYLLRKFLMFPDISGLNS